jgi:integrase
VLFLEKIGPVDLSAKHLDAFYEGMQQKGLAAGTIRMQHATNSGALTQAVKWEWVPSSKAKLATPPAKVRRDPKALTAAEVRKMIVAAEEGDIDLALWIVRRPSDRHRPRPKERLI